MNALVLSGGGSRGAYQAGVLRALSESKFIDGTNAFNFIHGISVGSINACALAQFDKSDIGLAIKYLSEKWVYGIKSNRDIWKYKFPQINSPSIADASNLHAFIETNVDYNSILESDVELTISATRYKDGTCATIDKRHPYFVEFVKASAAFPIYFPPIEINGEIYIDGHISDREPLSHVIKAGANNIIVIDTSNSSARNQKSTIFTIVRDVIKIAIDGFMYADYSKCLRVNEDIANGKLVGKKYIDIIYISPSQNLSKTLDFDRKSISRNYMIGHEDGMRIANKYAIKCNQFK